MKKAAIWRLFLWLAVDQILSVHRHAPNPAAAEMGGGRYPEFRTERPKANLDDIVVKGLDFTCDGFFAAHFKLDVMQLP